ncbi:MAG: sigma-70 family RNA polymerase sigma factor [Bacteroidales bacterium]|nr:sigma-70 family RNA polymerase sigma factor [Bacteroidales bacterium]
MTVDEKIVEGCIAGKRRAQNQLYQKYAPGMFGVCLRYCKNIAEAEDILQEGFIKVFKNVKKYRKEGSFEGWIRRIMVNSAITHFNKNKIHFEEIDEEKMESPEEAETNETFAPVDQEILLNLIQNMPEGYRMVLNLYVFEGYNHKEISDILNISENTSKSQLSKARKYLKNKLEEINKVKTASFAYERQF